MPSPAAPYTPFYPGGWQDNAGGATPLEQAPLNHIEAGIGAALPAPTGPNSGDLPIWNPAANGGAGGWDTTTNMKIAKASLASLQIVDGDISAAAAISLAKLNGFPNSAAKFARGDGVWATPLIPGSIMGLGIGQSVSTAGTSFAGGANLLASNISFTADGISRYAVLALGPNWSTNSSAQTTIIASAVFDGAQGNLFDTFTFGTNVLLPFAGGIDLGVVSAAVHTINIRIYGGTGTTAVTAGAIVTVVKVT